MSSKPTKSKQDEALQFLEDLDSYEPVEAPPTSGNAGVPNPPSTDDAEAAKALAFLDEITQKSSELTRTATSHIERPVSRAGTPTLRKSTERVRLGHTSTSSSTSLRADATAKKTTPEALPAPGAWGWGSVWTSASAAIQQAKSAVDEQVKHLPKNEQARKWGEGVMEYAKTAQLDKLGQDFKRVGMSTLTDLLNVVAPPISEHEVIQVWLSHDMRGYEGIETLVYRALARIMEQVDGGDLVVNRGQGQQSIPSPNPSDGRDLGTVDGYEAALKLAQADLDELIKNNSKPTAETPLSQVVTYSSTFLRVQPFLTSFTLPQQPTPSSSDAPAAMPTATTQSQLQFLLYLSDPGHKLVHTTVTQAVPAPWLELWDKYEWVEDLVAESMRVGVEVIGQEYVVARMGWGEDRAMIGSEEADEKKVET